MTTRRGNWDCSDCGTKQIDPRERVCPNCGSPRETHERFYLPNDAPVVTESEELARAEEGPNWVCGYCGGANRNRDGSCAGCRGGKSEGKAYQPDRPASDVSVAQGALKDLEPSPWFHSRAVMVTLSCFFVSLLGWFLWLTFSTQAVTMTVKYFAWQRSIAIENLVTARHEGWSVPSGGREISSKRRVKSYKDVKVGEKTVRVRVISGYVPVKVGTKDLGNGYFEDITSPSPIYTTTPSPVAVTSPSPVFATSYVYEIDNWTHARTEQSAGANQQPFWPPANPGLREREANRSERYEIVCLDPNQRACPAVVSEVQFRALTPGQKVTARVNGWGTILSLDN